MKALQEFHIALRAYRSALGLLSHKRVRIFLLIPVFINMLLLLGGYTLLGNWATHLSESLFELVGAKEWTFWGSAYFDELLLGLLHLIFKVLFLLFMLFYGGFIVILLMSPLFSLLSERVEELETQKIYPFSVQKLLQDVWRGMRVALRNAMLQLLLSLLIFMIGFIPIVGFLAPLLFFITTAYFYGFSFMDFALERHYPTLRGSVHFVRKHRVAAFTNGAVFALSLLLPLCNLFLAAFVAVWSVIAATITLLNIKKVEGKREISNLI